uniref:Cytochrome P450 CYP3033A1 n=1 Tax=Tigriopus kingsejongensis TaxID=1133412 RepID=A0A2H4FY69_9MAXI|nr:cytochrome P450 CYP3033A1 [Tigriopus kingsejongensis]
MAFQVILLSGMIWYCFLKWLKYYKVPDNFPPGPPSVPLLGVLPFMQGNLKDAMQRWRKEYGEVVGLHLGSELTVVLSDFDEISNAFKDKRFTGRPKALTETMTAFFASHPGEKGGGIVFSEGEQWSEQRRFALKTLRDFGFSKKAMEDVILEEVFKMIQVLRADEDSMSLNQVLSVGVVNSLWTILTGQKLSHGDQTVMKIVTGTDDFINNESMSGPLMMMPWLRFFPYIKEKFQASKEAPLSMRKLQNKMVAQHEEEQSGELDNNNGVRKESKDFIDVYLDKIKETRDRKSSFFGDQGRLNLQRSLTDIFGAGTSSGSSMLLFAFLYVIKYPKIQTKVQDELSRIIGKNTVSLDDRSNMPYTDAVLHEVMRHSCLVYAVPHATTEDVSVQGFDLPKDTVVYANLWQVMHNTDYWQDPEIFRPERFLDRDSKFRRDERCIPFMLGKRFCIGQSLALQQLFLFFVTILQHFELQAPGGAEAVSIEPIVGFVHQCPKYSVKLVGRM